MSIDLKAHIRQVPDFPKQGILFYDIATLLANGPAWQEAVEKMAAVIEKEKPDLLVAIESRGFLLAAPLAAKLGIGLMMVRKKGKLPGKTAGYNYALEYGTDTLEIQEGITSPGTTALIVDDVLATGGTARAALTLARQIGLKVTGAAFLIELPFLNGRKAVDIPITALLSYDD